MQYKYFSVQVQSSQHTHTTMVLDRIRRDVNVFPSSSADSTAAAPGALPSATQYPGIIESKIVKELAAGRIIGPLSSPPAIDKYRVSPLGVVPKKKPGERRCGDTVTLFASHNRISVPLNSMNVGRRRCRTCPSSTRSPSRGTTCRRRAPTPCWSWPSPSPTACSTVAQVSRAQRGYTQG